LENNPFACIPPSPVSVRGGELVDEDISHLALALDVLRHASCPVRVPPANPPSCVVFDPLDGSSNIDAGVNVGTIFGVYKVVSVRRTLRGGSSRIHTTDRHALPAAR
jgi:hypothetical protein